MKGVSKRKQRAFPRDLVAYMREKAAGLTEAGFDPAQRIAVNTSYAVAAEQREGEQRARAAEARLATKASWQALNTAYREASAVISLVKGYMGRRHPFVKNLHKLRQFPLNRARKLSFVLRMKEWLKKNASLLREAGLDPDPLITAIRGQVDEVARTNGRMLGARADLRKATKLSRKAADESYRQASRTIMIAAGLLGNDHELVREMRKLRN